MIVNSHYKLPDWRQIISHPITMHHKVRVSSARDSMCRDMRPGPAPRRSIALILIVSMAAGCSKAVEIPRVDLEKPEYREPGAYRIRLKGTSRILGEAFFCNRLNNRDR
jgi:hypothetical protein